VRIPVAAEGLPFIFPPAVAACILAWMGWPVVAGILAAVALAFLAFFRDPERTAPALPGAVLAPADGKVMGIAEVEDRWVGRAVRLSIFLSPLDVHVNRAPAAGLVRDVEYVPGRFLAAYKPEASEQNERCTVALEADVARLSVRQISGVLARRIVCRARPGDRLRTTAAVVAVAPRRAGAYVLTRYATVDVDGAPVSATDYGSVYLGVACDPEGELPRAPEASGDEAAGADAWTAEVPIPATLAHVYTECARIWNPIHTDPAVARQAGLSAILLHGTATLALAVSAALAREPRGAETPVARIACRFTGMVSLPSRLTVTGRAARAGDGGNRATFRAATPDGRAVLSGGWLDVGPSEPAPRSPR